MMVMRTGRTSQNFLYWTQMQSSKRYSILLMKPSLLQLVPMELRPTDLFPGECCQVNTPSIGVAKIRLVRISDELPSCFFGIQL